MARPLRVQYPNALYHVMARGNAYNDIFLNDTDRLSFLHWLKDIVERHNIVCHAFCLMDNHYHLLLETPDANLSNAMRDLNGNYSQSFHARHGSIGHLFQGRYKAFVIEKDPYLLEVARYIALNPVRDGLVSHPRFWKWSSYNATVGSAGAPDWLETDWLLGNFSDRKKMAQAEYRRFVKAGINGRDPYEDLEHNLILGTSPFVHWIWENVTNGSEQIREYPREQRIVGRQTLKELFSDVKTREERDKMIIFARLRCGYLGAEIAREVGLDPSTVGKISREAYNMKK
jgi:putative transposase